MAVDTPSQVLKFLCSDMSAPTGSGRYTVGKWRSVRGELVPCKNGLHGTTSDLLLPFMSDSLWRAEIGDEFVWHGERGVDRKIVVRRMRIIERVEAWNARTARLFAADCAERALPLFEARYQEDRRPRGAIEVARRFARDEATQEELANAAANAYAAANAAANAANAAAYAANAAAYAANAAERAWQARHLADMLGLPWDAEAVS